MVLNDLMKKEKKKMRNVISILLSVTLLTAGVTAMAGSAGKMLDPPKPPHYLPVTGTVVSVQVSEDQEGWLHVSITDEDGNPATLVITDRTVFPFESGIAAGDIVTGYYLSDAPMTLIWPPIYTAAVFVAGMPESMAVAADRFYAMDSDQDFMLSQSGQLAFRIDENTEIVLANGDDFADGYIEGRRMIVIYGPFVTASYPAQATAIKVIVLYEDPVPLSMEVSPDMFPGTDTDIAIDATGWPIIVNGDEIDAPDAFQTEDGTLMVPLRAIVEKLGYDVNWDSATRSVRLGVAIHLWIGNTEVHVGRRAPQDISAAPVIVNATTFVPLDFFRNVLNVPNAIAFEGRIEINSTGEGME